MSETTFPFGAVRDDAPAGDEQEADRGRLALVLGGGLLAVALVGGAVFVFTGGDDTAAEDASAASVVRAPAAAPQVEEQPQTVPVANTEATARSPFEPKYVEPAPVVEAPAEAPSDPAAVPTTIVVRDSEGRLVTVPTGGSAVTPAQPAPVTPAPAAPREYRLVLTGVSTDGDVPTAQFTIDGAVSSVTPTEIFGPQRQLLLRSLQQGPKDGQWTATIQVGDARPIDVVTNQAVYVQ